MKGNFDAALARVLVYEGGYVNDPQDPGGATNKGITQSTYNSWRSRHGQAVASVQSISDADVAAIYKADYWDRVYADELPAGVDFCIFDAAVNSGVGSAAAWAQAVMNMAVDSDFGPKTRDAVKGDDPEDFIHDFCARRLATLKRLKTWSRFGKGWSARIANVQKVATAWAAGESGPNAVQVSTIQGNAKSNINDVPTSKLSTVTTTATTAGGVIATTATTVGASLAGASSLQWVSYTILGLTVVSAIAGGIVLMMKQWNDNAANAVAKAPVDTDADLAVPPGNPMPAPASVIQVVAKPAGT